MVREETLEDYPLAKAYSWRVPKQDTGGILYLYPMVRTKRKVHYKLKSDDKTDFKYNQRQRPHALNPDDIMTNIKFRDNGEPHFSRTANYKPRGEQQ